MILYRGKISKKILAVVSVFLLAVLLCISPYTDSRVYAATSSDTSIKAVLSNGSFGILKKVNNTYYVVDEYGNIIDGVVSPTGSSLDRYIGKQILLKDNIFAGLVESQQRRGNTFFNKLREYLSGIVSNPKFVTPKPITPIDKPKPIIGPGPIDPIDIVHPMYGVETPIKIEPIDPIDIVHPMYGVETPIKIEPIDLIKKPIEAGSAIDKIAIIEKQTNDRKALENRGIKIVPEMKNEPKPFQDGNEKK